MRILGRVTGLIVVLLAIASIVEAQQTRVYRIGVVLQGGPYSVAVDPDRRSVLANNEDGALYRWDLSTNTLSQKLQLNNGLGQAYTPTAIGADGTVFAISNAVMYAVRAS